MQNHLVSRRFKLGNLLRLQQLFERHGIHIEAGRNTEVNDRHVDDLTGVVSDRDPALNLFIYRQGRAVIPNVDLERLR